MSKLYHVNQLPLFPVESVPQKKQPRYKDKAYRNQKAREWRAANKERVAQNNKTYNEANKEKLVQYRKERHVVHRERLNQKCRESYKIHQEKRLQGAKAYRNTHQEEIKLRRAANKEQLRIKRLARRYGISLEEWNILYERQNGCCAICNKPLEDKLLSNGNKDTAVDHCHETGVVRGILCGKCNSGIGMLDDDPDICLRAYQYLSKFLN